MSLADVLAPAIDYAENGYPIDPSLATAIDRAQSNLSTSIRRPRRCSCRADAPPRPGELFKNPDLASDAEESWSRPSRRR